MKVDVKEHTIYLDTTKNDMVWVVKKKDDFNYMHNKYFKTFEGAFDYVRSLYPEEKCLEIRSKYFYIGVGMFVSILIELLIYTISII